MVVGIIVVLVGVVDVVVVVVLVEVVGVVVVKIVVNLQTLKTSQNFSAVVFKSLGCKSNIEIVFPVYSCCKYWPTFRKVVI